MDPTWASFPLITSTSPLCPHSRTPRRITHTCAEYLVGCRLWCGNSPHRRALTSHLHRVGSGGCFQHRGPLHHCLAHPDASRTLVLSLVGCLWRDNNLHLRALTSRLHRVVQPVGVGDGGNATDLSIVLPTCDAGGRLLQPDRPLLAIDATFTRVSTLLNRSLHLAILQSFDQETDSSEQVGQDERGAPNGQCKSTWMSAADGGAVWASVTELPAGVATPACTYCLSLARSLSVSLPPSLPPSPPPPPPFPPHTTNNHS